MVVDDEEIQERSEMGERMAGIYNHFHGGSEGDDDTVVMDDEWPERRTLRTVVGVLERVGYR